MRVAVGAMLIFCSTGLLRAQPEADNRFGVALDTKTYPQTTPQEALASVARAIEARRVDYVLAYLADPRMVDTTTTRDFSGSFVQYVRATEGKLTPEVAKLFTRFVKEGEWKTEGDTASATLKDVKDKGVFLIKVNGRWRLENRQQAASKSAEEPPK